MSLCLGNRILDPSLPYLYQSLRLQMLQEFTLRLIHSGVPLLLELQLGLHRRDRFRRAGGPGLDPGGRQDEAAEHHGHRDQGDRGDSRDLNRCALRRRSHVRLRERFVVRGHFYRKI